MTNEEYTAQSEKFRRIVRAIRATDPWLANDLGKHWENDRDARGTFQAWVCENYYGWDPQFVADPAPTTVDGFYQDDDEYWNEDDDDFPLYMEYDEGMDDMYADGDGFFTNDPGDYW